MKAGGVIYQAAASWEGLFLVPWDYFAASFEPCSWATLAMVGRVEAEMLRLQQVVPGWGKLTSPNLAAYLLILAETTSFSPLKVLLLR